MANETKNLKNAGEPDAFSRLFAGTVQYSRHMSRLDKVSASMQSLEWSLMRRSGSKAPVLVKTAGK